MVSFIVHSQSSGEAARRLGGGFSFDAINELAYTSRQQLFLNNTVQELLFDGVSSYMMDAAEDIGVHVPYDKFGWFYKKNNTAFDGTYRIFSGQANTMDKLGLMDTWNGQGEISYWSGAPCTRMDRSSPGDLRPPFFNKRPEHIHVFAADICRFVRMRCFKELSLNLFC